MYTKVAWLGLLLGTSAVWAQDGSTNAPNLASASRPVGTAGSPGEEGPNLLPSGLSWQHELAQLKTEREGLEGERNPGSSQPLVAGSATEEQIALLRLRVSQLLTKVAVQNARSKASGAEKAPSSPGPMIMPLVPIPREASATVPQKPTPGTKANVAEIPISVALNRPIDALALAQSLFRTDDYAGALRAYRMVDPSSLAADNRLIVPYMIATCLRNQGKLAEASTLFREVANAKGGDILVDCAQWQLSSIEWRQQLQAELDQVRQRRKAWEAKAGAKP
jgi:hypothetical protein